MKIKIKGVDITSFEFAESIVKGAVATIPFAGGIASAYGDWQNKVQIVNIQDIINKVIERLESLETLVNKGFTNSDSYTALLINVAFKGQNELSEDKRTLYAEFAVACCLKENPQNDYMTYLDIVSRLNRTQLNILAITDRDAPGTHNWSSGNFTKIKCRVNEDVYVQRELDYLVSIGLVAKIDVQGIGRMFASIGFEKDVPHFIGTENIYSRTSLGNSLYEFLKPALIQPS